MANDLILKVEKDHTISMDCGGIRETYSLKEAPDASSTLVVTEKKNILHKMDLDTVLKNLDNSVDLLNVAYHAVYGFDVQTQIWDLQKTLMDLNDKGINVIDDFARQSSAVIHDLCGKGCNQEIGTLFCNCRYNEQTGGAAGKGLSENGGGYFRNLKKHY